MDGRISTSLESLKACYDAVVIGSGYGGSAACLRFAEHGFRTALLEKGQEYLPGELPRTAAQVAGQFRTTPLRKKPKRDFLYDNRLGGDANVVVANGLGGGS